MVTRGQTGCKWNTNNRFERNSKESESNERKLKPGVFKACKAILFLCIYYQL